MNGLRRLRRVVSVTRSGVAAHSNFIKILALTSSSNYFPPPYQALVFDSRILSMANEHPGTITPMTWGEEPPAVPHIGDHDHFPDILRKLSLYVPHRSDCLEITNWVLADTLLMLCRLHIPLRSFVP